MGFDLDMLARAVAAHGRVVRVVIAATHGSCPRETGAAMLVWENGQSGTIGGGALEYELARAAREQAVACRHSRHALGPEMGQCCGGAVEVVSEVFDAAALPEAEMVFARPVAGSAAMPLSVKRLLATARNQGRPPEAQLLDGWMIEPVARPTREIWIWGAGHVGRALVAVLTPLPAVRITWVDTGPDRFPDAIPEGVAPLPAAEPARLVPHAPSDAHHLVLTYSHALDLELCHQLLSHGFASAGLIGSKTKWARFRKRLAALGHGEDQIDSIRCPIGDPALGKHPQAIAVGVAAEILRPGAQTRLQQGKTA
ncbi:xanthine dehydrogenase accessory protein XdhC [Roseovarius indicus]|uniref:Molybdenum cofactor sulfurylase n=1 Tax=Roseovarius indicus TaxID=540747 RepID=A0A0T5PCM7_9RHOB|nr:xanthine dehydrogenase accessory protein XdhC [Roseovarius indicus]KRS18776.1 molybdenum cofactor sulfurylase [Roseovarius indicus]QEW26328.1 xanthine dehydrogenase accessory protein XdhC [Roseovarius indicus]SFD96224.1 molybdenum cofactor sulfurylase [Roseovarius indicus]